METNQFMPDSKTPFVVIVSQIVLGLFAFFYILVLGQEIILPLVYALILAILLNPVVNFLCKHGFNRILSIFTAVLLMITIICALIYFIGSQGTRFSSAFPALQEKLNVLINDASVWFSTKLSIESDKVQGWIAKKKAEEIADSGRLVGKTLLTLTTILTWVFLLPVYIFMFLFYKPLLLDFISKLFPKERHSTIAEILVETKALIQSYLIGLLLEAAIIATLNFMGLLILALILGILGAVLNVIPYIGGIIATALPMIIALATKTPVYALWVLVTYLIVQFIDNHYIVPKIVASKVKINALVSLVVVFLGNAIWGIPGMFLSIPLTALIKVIFDRIEPLKPWGFLLGDSLPPIGKTIFKFKPRKISKS
jgi:predicted PurR-regulated permease PerM